MYCVHPVKDYTFLKHVTKRVPKNIDHEILYKGKVGNITHNNVSLVQRFLYVSIYTECLEILYGNFRIIFLWVK